MIGSVVGACGADIYVGPSSIIDVSMAGCLAGHGPGSLPTTNNCAGAGASYANTGGAGGAIIS